jgi:histidinol dehydrogenase
MSDLQLFIQGRLSDLTPGDRSAVMNRVPAHDEDLAGAVADLIADVRSRGDAALMEFAERFDSVVLSELEIPQVAWTKALDELDHSVRHALERAAENIQAFHVAQLPLETRVEVEPGVTVTRMWTPLARAGVYAPGGTAAYPSSVLMGAVAASAAGVDEIIVCSPPGLNGLPPAEVMAACAIAGVDRLFALGGAGAVAALAYGTASVPVADAVVGPGNRWVAEAKRQVAGDIVIDAPAGPSEVLVIADDTADSRLVAMEMVAQAEHDRDAVSVLVSTSERVADAVCASLMGLLESGPRAAIARAALGNSGAVLIADSMQDALGFSEEFAPEHLSLMTAGASEQARNLRNAGTIFVGQAASVAFGDYMTGANHVLPTGGRARSFSGLATQHFLRSFTVQEIDASGARAMAGDVATLATVEGLPAHAQAAEARIGS